MRTYFVSVSRDLQKKDKNVPFILSKTKANEKEPLVCSSARATVLLRKPSPRESHPSKEQDASIVKPLTMTQTTAKRTRT